MFEYMTCWDLVVGCMQYVFLEVIFKHSKMSKFVKKIIKQALGEQKDDLWITCKHTMSTIDALTQDIGVDKDVLNRRQCLHLTQKLSNITCNIEGLLSQCKESKLSYFKLASLNFGQYLEKAKALVENCRQKNWLVAAIFQCQNEKAFREILFDIGLCYNAIYEHAQSLSEDWDAQLKDLRLDPSIFLLEDDDIHQDKFDLQKKLEDFVLESTNVVTFDPLLSLETCKALANYLLVKMQFLSQQSHGNAMDASSPLLWQKKMEPKDTWGDSKYLGSGSNKGGVCSTKWLGTPCAKKEFHLKEYESLFLKEASIMAYMKHPCIISFICCGNGQAKGDRFIAMELMEKSLDDLIQDQKGVPFSLPIVVDIIMQIARGMWYLHDCGVAHRDLKPQNVVLNRLTHPHLEDHFCLKLVDFGTSKTQIEASKSNTMTQCGIGTTIYRAPEVHPEAHPKAKKGIQGKANWFKADIFSFAMTCVHLLTLKMPFQGAYRPKELFNVVMNGARPSLPKSYPEELLALLSDCWNIIPRKRPFFLQICERLEILRYKIWRGYFPPHKNLIVKEINLEQGLDFCKTMLDIQSSLQKGFVDGINQAMQVDDDPKDDKIDKVAILPCLCGHALELLHKNPYKHGSQVICNVCKEEIRDDIYHCQTCDYDAHPKCVEIEDKVEVFFHHHPLYLLIQHYYDNNLDATCLLCEELVQQSEWVYHCKECDIDIHAHCTKYPEKLYYRSLHSHPLTMIQCHPQKIVLYTQCCNGEIRGQGLHFKCTRKFCAFRAHPMCCSISLNPFCIFDYSHRLSRETDQRIFHCGRCGSLGYSWYYHCCQCKVQLHLDCIDIMNEENDDLNDAYEKFMAAYELTNDDHRKMEMISKLMDETLVYKPSKARSSSTSLSSSSSSLGIPQVIMKVQPSILRPTKIQETILDEIISENLYKEIVANDVKRKAEKMALVKEARQKSKVNLLEIYRNLKKNVEDLQSSKTSFQIDKDILSIRLKSLKERCCALEYEINTLRGHGQGQTSQHGPRIVLFFEFQQLQPYFVGRLLTSLLPQSSDMCYVFLCEEPGHEHIADVVSYPTFIRFPTQSFINKIKPMLRIGLQIVTSAIKSSLVEPSTLDVVTLPTLGKWKFLVNSIDLETYNSQNMKSSKDKEDVEALKVVEDSARQFFLNYAIDGCFFSSFGLQCIRYIVSDESKVPCYTRGMEAWLCEDHLESGLDKGILEHYPSKFYNWLHR